MYPKSTVKSVALLQVMDQIEKVFWEQERCQDPWSAAEVPWSLSGAAYLLSVPSLLGLIKLFFSKATRSPSSLSLLSFTTRFSFSLFLNTTGATRISFLQNIQLLFVLFPVLPGLPPLDGGTSIFKVVMGKNGHKRDAVQKEWNKEKRRDEPINCTINSNWLSENGHRAQNCTWSDKADGKKQTPWAEGR